MSRTHFDISFLHTSRDIVFGAESRFWRFAMLFSHILQKVSFLRIVVGAILYFYGMPSASANVIVNNKDDLKHLDEAHCNEFAQERENFLTNRPTTSYREMQVRGTNLEEFWYNVGVPAAEFSYNRSERTFFCLDVAGMPNGDQTLFEMNAGIIWCGDTQKPYHVADKISWNGSACVGNPRPLFPSIDGSRGHPHLVNQQMRFFCGCGNEPPKDPATVPVHPE
ncbi:MAG: hypothetical protein M1837_005571 [Sclerophora amabilis]|nr:MAG: hypothetical protein M1837_005571 [Sclerophora amabilis]